MIGEVLAGRYQIVRFLAEGGMGEVYRASDPRLSRDVAIKVLPSSFRADPDMLRRLEQEARAAGSLNHPNILAVHDVGSHDGAPYVVSELLEGTTLREKLAWGALPTRRALDYATQIARGLAAAHERGIAHRDLKPENLFVTEDGRVKILDFGLAKLTPLAAREEAETLSRAEGGTTPGTILGTIGYMSPEQVRGKPADHRSDIFSFGAVLYEMLAGRRAFKGETPADTLTAILAKELPEISTPNGILPPALDRIVRRCLEKNPDARFRSAHDLGFALEALSGLSVAGAPAPGPARVPVRLSLGALALALGVLLLVGAAFVVGRRFEKNPPPSFRQLTFRRGTVSAARFTPDGQTIVYSAAWDGGPADVFATRPDTVESRSLGLPNTTLVATAPGEMALLQHTVHDWQGTLARTSLTGGAPREVAHRVWEADWTRDGAHFAVVLWHKGKSRLEFPVGRLLYEGSSGRITNPRISPGGDHVAFIDDEWTAASIALVDRSGWNRILSSGWTSATGLAWSPDGKEVWFTASKEGIGQALHAVTLSGKERVVARVPGTLTLQDIFFNGYALLTHTRSRREVWGPPPGETRDRDLSWLDETSLADLSDDGKTLLFVDRGSVYLRRTDGSAPVRLCEGADASLSPDGKWVISYPSTSPSHLTLVPTGAGEPRTLPAGTVHTHMGVHWFPDGKRILITGHEKGRGRRLFVQNLDEGPPRPFTPEDAWSYGATRPISPDGRLVVVFTPQPGHWTLRATDGSGEPRDIPGLPAPTDADVLRWSADGRYLFVRERAAGLPVRIQRLDLRSGKREPWKEVSPADRTGVVGDGIGVFLTPDGHTYLYDYRRRLSDLYLVEGLK